MSTPERRKVPLLGLPMAPNTHLLETKLFRVLVGCPLALGLVFFCIALGNSWGSLTLCGEAECFSKFFELFKFPIGTMSIAIPLGALIASQHRSVQTKEQIDSQWKQIEAQENQNIFANHLAHRTHFNEFFEEFKPFEDENTYSKWEVYESIFPNAPEGNFDVNPSAEFILSEIEGLLEGVAGLIKAKDLELGIPMKLRLVGLNSKSEELIGLSETVVKNEHVELPANQLQKYLRFFEKISLGLHSCMNFHRTYVPHTRVQNICQRIQSQIVDLEPTGRRERLAKAIAIGVATDLDNRQKAVQAAQNIRETIEKELDKLKKHEQNQLLSFDSLSPVIQEILNEYADKSQRDKALKLMPGLMIELLSQTGAN